MKPGQKMAMYGHQAARTAATADRLKQEPTVDRKPSAKTCLECGKTHGVPRSFCSAECCAKFKAKKKAAK
jgi:hypothetical protein